MSHDDFCEYDLIIIGSGPSARRAAIQSAKVGKAVLVIERSRRIGGVSVHTGTIPSKTLRETVLNLSGWRERGFYGRSYRVKQDIEARDLMVRMAKTLDHEVDVLEHQFRRNGVRVAHGEARFVGMHEIEVRSGDQAESRRNYTGRNILISCGTKPFRPDNVPFNGKNVLDSDEIVDLRNLPRSLTVIGAGVIGVEYATIFSALDVAVTLIEPRSSFLDFIDRELIEEFTHEMRDRKLALRLGSAIASIEINDAKRPVVTLANGRVVKSEMLLYAAGRIGATAGLNLEVVGIEVDGRGRISVDHNTLQTKVPHIYAAGDVIGFPSLASTSMEQGRRAACHAFGLQFYKTPENFPYGIYSVPEISTVGMTEEQVRKEGIPHECGIARFRETSRGQIMGLKSGIMKMIFSTETRRCLGVHIVGEGATELIHIGQAVINLQGTIDFFIENTFNYPTLAEAYKIAALDAWNRMTGLMPNPDPIAELDPV